VDDFIKIVGGFVLREIVISPLSGAAPALHFLARLLESVCWASIS
jgi:hypothetical protein